MTSEKLSTKLSVRLPRRLFTVMFIAANALILMGCGSLIKPSKVELPLSLTKPAPKLTPLDGATGADMLRKFIEVSGQYYELADRTQALVEACK